MATWSYNNVFVLTRGLRRYRHGVLMKLLYIGVSRKFKRNQIFAPIAGMVCYALNDGISIYCIFEAYRKRKDIVEGERRS